MNHPTGSLNVPNGQLPLQAMSIRARITGLLYTTTVSQTYLNQHDVPLEATYIFPLPPRAAVAGYTMKVGEEVTEGVLMPRKQARQRYRTGLSSGRRSSVAEQERPDVFSVRVGNIAPQESITVELRLEGPLTLEGYEACFRFPLVVGPRYIPGQLLDGPQAGPGIQLDTQHVPDASRISPPILLEGHPNPVRLSIEVEVETLGLSLDRLQSSLHQVTMVDTSKGYRVVLGQAERLDRDFILRLSLRPATHLLVGPDLSFLLTVVPPQPSENRPGRDVLLMLDRSGSMQGWKMQAAANAAAEIIENLNPRDRFGVILFDSRPEDGPFPQLEPAYDQTKLTTARFLRQVQAQGGTEMLQAFHHASRYLQSMGPDKSLVLITDGEVGDHDAVMEWAGTQPDIRFFVVGIDHSPSHALLDRLATQSGGLCRMVESQEKLSDALSELHRAVGQPVLQQLEVLPSARHVCPQRWDVFPGHPALFHGQLAVQPHGSVQLRAMLPDGSVWTESVQATLTEAEVVTRAWARARILDMEDAWSSHHDNEPEIIELSLQYQVLSRFTAFVAIDPQQRQLQGPLHQVVQPVENVRRRRVDPDATVAHEEPYLMKRSESKKPESVVQLMHVDTLTLEVGRGLLALVDPNQGAKLLEAVSGLRRRLAAELGIVLPGVRFRDNLQLAPQDYLIKLKEIEIFRGQVDPWQAEAVELVLAELEKVIREHAADLLGRQEVQALLDTVNKGGSKVVAEVIPRLSLGQLQKILQNLARERISIKALERILQTLADHPNQSDTDWLTTQVRVALAPQLCQPLLQADGRLPALTLPTDCVQLPGLPMALLQRLDEAVARYQPRAVVAAQPIRQRLRELIAERHPLLPVLAYEEIQPAGALLSLAEIQPELQTT